jgi:hypothetical protein
MVVSLRNLRRQMQAELERAAETASAPRDTEASPKRLCLAQVCD